MIEKDGKTVSPAASLAAGNESKYVWCCDYRFHLFFSILQQDCASTVKIYLLK